MVRKLQMLIMVFVVSGINIALVSADLTENDLRQVNEIVQREVQAAEKRLETRLVRYVDLKFDGLRTEMLAKFEGVQQQFEGIQQQFEGIQQQFESIQKQFEGIQKQFEGMQKQFEGMQKQLHLIMRLLEFMLALMVALIAIPQFFAIRDRRKVAQEKSRIEQLERQMAIDRRKAEEDRKKFELLQEELEEIRLEQKRRLT